MAIYAASRINQLRKSSSAASQLCKTNKIKNLHFGVVRQPSKLSILSALQSAMAALDDVRNELIMRRVVAVQHRQFW